MTKAYAIGAATLVAVMLAGLALFAYQPPFLRTMLGMSDDPFDPCRSGAVMGGLDQIGGPFTLVNAQGQTVTDQDVMTMPSIVYFGYTFCPDVCPLDSARNALATELLEAEGQIVQPVFISIDPERDTPEVVGEFASIFHPRMIGLTGSDEQVRAASRAYRTYFSRQEGDDQYYLVDHSTFSYLVIPGHGTVEIFRHDTPAEEVAEIAQCYLSRV
ncbi:SCO family protein [Pararhodobacter aggregans]|uniref:SCO family protein n=1 Tax=Pararhodobacter aggregans TaxID=404875 RepID=A0A2T7UU97_9RHOB|nr:SCO family protein [Pararhodobacter aggregans]PTX02934.1 protein SCO1/2 [Pararhodobacter aggregans]PVE48149.1 SCO family protein [Pararhodobacter aggregans]